MKFGCSPVCLFQLDHKFEISSSCELRYFSFSGKLKYRLTDTPLISLSVLPPEEAAGRARTTPWQQGYAAAPRGPMNTRAGTYRTNLSGELTYKSFVPAPLPPNPPIRMTEELSKLLVTAHSLLAELNNKAKHIPSIDVFVSMHVVKEALISSQIEGTQATLEDVLDPLLDTNVNRDVADVVNYIKATDFAIGKRQELPLCNRLLRETHAVLMSGARGQEKYPGEFRCTQNWIGSQGCTLKNAKFVPPCPEDMIVAMSDLEKYINDDDETDHLIRISLIHYQFETIHPFVDGNGRIGRLLIILYLIEKNILSEPILYISYFLKKYRSEYYSYMSDIRNNGSYEKWIQFFLRAVIESSKDAINTIDKLFDLRQNNTEKILHFGRLSKNMMKVFNYIEKKPIIDIGITAKELNLSFNTISKIVKNLVETNILAQVSKGKRNRVFAYEAYLEILRTGTIHE